MVIPWVSLDFQKLFNILDCDQDEKLSRKDLHSAAKRMAWGWPEAPFFAVFDLLTLLGPISQKTFQSYMKQIAEDPLGFYGNILLNVNYDLSAIKAGLIKNTIHQGKEIISLPKKDSGNIFSEDIFNDALKILNQAGGKETARDYERLLAEFDFAKLHYKDVAMLIIDPQRSFTKGAWMQSIGYRAQQDIAMIDLGFSHCAKILGRHGDSIETMFSRCPFPPDSYDWDEHFHGVISNIHPYFIKPGNNIMFPSANGFRNWVERLTDKGITILVIGGCTLNSCLRVSAIDTRKIFKKKNLRVVVDLSISGARIANYRRMPIFGGLSSVNSAIQEMIESGVDIVKGIIYSV